MKREMKKFVLLLFATAVLFTPMCFAQDDLNKLLPLIKQRDPQLYFACLMQFYCFIRPGWELRLMKVGDIDLDQHIIRVPLLRAKNKTTEVVTIPAQFEEACREYSLVGADKSLYVFGRDGCPGSRAWSVNMLTHKFNKFRDELGLSKDYKFYSMKHTGATMLHESGMPIRAEMDQLRHKRLSATQHYIKKHAGMINEKIRYEFPSPVNLVVA